MTNEETAMAATDLTTMHGSPDRRRPTRRKNPMERVIEGLATGLGDAIGFMAARGILFAVFALIWVAVAAGLLFAQGSVHDAWRAIGELPLVVRVVVWVLFLPVTVGLWIWETSWPLIARLILVAGVAGWNLLIFLPGAAQPK
jgi:hypothetical protein